MDQESFRKLLEKPTATSPTAASSAHVRGSLLSAAASGKKKQKTVDASQPAFKPRTLKKNAKGQEYRDRATERRLGVNNDYAQVEALAEDFERKNAENEDREAVEQQRRYLGGDSEHTVLVKGLDFALLEQNRARVAAETAATEDVSLEQAFLESSTQPKKRTREDILRELKSKRGAPDAESAPAVPSAADKALEEAKKAGKFKPIGFKPIGGSSATVDGKVKRKKKVKTGHQEENGERKKKRKVAADGGAQTSTTTASTTEPGPSKSADMESTPSPPSTSTHPNLAPAPEPEPEPMDEYFDIFAGAGEYAGVDLGDDDASDEEGAAPATESRIRDDEEGEVRENGPARPGKWLATSDDEREPSPPPLPPARGSKSASRSMSPQRRSQMDHGPPRDEEEGELEDEEERPVRLQPLASSAMPSIKDMLAMSEEAEKAEQRRLRKEKKKAGGGGGGGGTGGSSEKDTKAKIDRDYQRLKAYTDKKNKA